MAGVLCLPEAPGLKTLRHGGFPFADRPRHTLRVVSPRFQLKPDNPKRNRYRSGPASSLTSLRPNVQEPAATVARRTIGINGRRVPVSASRHRSPTGLGGVWLNIEIVAREAPARAQPS